VYLICHKNLLTEHTKCKSTQSYSHRVSSLSVVSVAISKHPHSYNVYLYPVYTIEQTSSKRRASVFKIHVLLLDVCCYMLAGRSSSMFARSRTWGITFILTKHAANTTNVSPYTFRTTFSISALYKFWERIITANISLCVMSRPNCSPERIIKPKAIIWLIRGYACQKPCPDYRLSILHSWYADHLKFSLCYLR